MFAWDHCGAAITELTRILLGWKDLPQSKTADRSGLVVEDFEDCE